MSDYIRDQLLQAMEDEANYVTVSVAELDKLLGGIKKLGERFEAAPEITDAAVERAAHTFCAHKWQKGLKDMPCNPCIKIAHAALRAAQEGGERDE